MKISTSIFLFFLTTFAFSQKQNTILYQVLEVNSSRIRINGKQACPGMQLTKEAKISFSCKEEELIVTTLNTHEYECKTHKKNEEWRYGEKRRIQKNGALEPTNFNWYLINHQTVSKGINGISEHIYMIGDFTCIEIPDVVDPDNEYYKITIKEGKNKDFYFYPDRDDTDPVIWIKTKHLPTNENNYKIKIDHVKNGETTTFADNVVLTIIH